MGDDTRVWQIESEGLRLAKKLGEERVSSVAKVKIGKTLITKRCNGPMTRDQFLAWAYEMYDELDPDLETVAYATVNFRDPVPG